MERSTSITTPNHITEATMLIKQHEGLRLKPYQCSAGKTTIGYGRNLQDTGISHDEALQMMAHDIERCEARLKQNFDWYNDLNETRKAVMIDMVYNLGFSRFSRFKKMIAAINDGNYGQAAREMMDSKWATQVGRRADTLSTLMRQHQ